MAATVALVPPLYGVFWRGFDSWSIAMTGAFAQPLAMAWLGVVGLRPFHQLRETARASGSGGGVGPQWRGNPLELIDNPKDA